MMELSGKLRDRVRSWKTISRKELEEFAYMAEDLERVIKAADAFEKQADGSVKWKGINPPLGNGTSSIDAAYQNLKLALGKAREAGLL